MPPNELRPSAPTDPLRGVARKSTYGEGACTGSHQDQAGWGGVTIQTSLQASMVVVVRISKSESELFKAQVLWIPVREYRLLLVVVANGKASITQWVTIRMFRVCG